MIHFELIFVKCVRSMSRFIILHVNIKLFQYHLLKRLSFLYFIAFDPLSKISWLCLHGPILELSILFHWPIPSPVPHCLDYYSFVVSLELGSVNPLSLFSSFNIVLAIQDLLPFYINVRIFVNIYKIIKINCWHFDCDCIESIDQVGKNWHLNKIESSSLLHGISFNLFSSSLFSFIRDF